MNKKQIALAVVLADHAALTAYAVAQHGFVGLFAAAFANAATVQIFADLTIALALVMVWMWRDAREQGIAPIPYMVMTLGLGSIGPLLYLIRRFGRAAAPASGTVLPTRVSAARA
jgi:flagellar biogenesis protein FliO